MRRDWESKLLVVTVFAIFVGSLYLIQVRYEARKLQSQLNDVEKFSKKLEEQARRYQIELATQTDYSEVLTEALNKHGMVFPDPLAGSLLTLQAPATRP